MSDRESSGSGGGLGCLGIIIIGALFGWAVLDLSPKAAVALGFKVALGWIGFVLVALFILVVLAVGIPLVIGWADDRKRRKDIRQQLKWDEDSR